MQHIVFHVIEGAPGGGKLVATPCRHRHLTRARGVSVAVKGGFLTSDERHPSLAYKQVTFCSSPTCERVLSATREEEL
jgi:hypothetical protein